MKLTVFWRWWTAGTASGLGSAVGGVALPLTALTVLHASAFEMGLIAAAGYFASLVISFANVLFAVANQTFLPEIVPAEQLQARNSLNSGTHAAYRLIVSPPEMLSRVIATVRFVSWGAIPIGGLIAGALAGPLGARTTLFLFGAVTLCAPLFRVFSPVRNLRELPLAEKETAPAQ
ncbi:hypothetical protein ACQP2E_11755 [Actinoplanes sp. CA-015351]|uniref:hypothetical protein n=1 Tax=Actinoplanes sp. CA-015351 TaxID=3239897 RepID=UPI003D95ADBF